MFFEFFKQAKQTVGSTSLSDLPDDRDDLSGSHYHRKIVYAGIAFGTIALIVGIVFSIMMASAPPPPGGQTRRELRGILWFPFLTTIIGFLFGMSIPCALAPADFLAGPVGEPWMKMIGTKSVIVARIVCVLFGLAVVGCAITLTIFFVLHPQNFR